jgi:hypothetical protein
MHVIELTAFAHAGIKQQQPCIIDVQGKVCVSKFVCCATLSDCVPASCQLCRSLTIHLWQH